MAVSVRESMLEDAARMAPNLRTADLRELQACCGPDVSPQEVLEAGIKTSKDPRTLEVDGEPAAIFGVVDAKEEEPSVCIVWLLGTNKIKDVRSYFLRNCKDVLENIGEPYEVLTNFVDARNTVHVKWLRWMGFTLFREVEDYGAESRTFYEFARIKVNV